jgi:hypothetical protein
VEGAAFHQHDRLAAIGFTDPTGALRHIGALTSGISRKATIQRHLMPVMIRWFADGVDPDYGLIAFRRLSERLPREERRSGRRESEGEDGSQRAVQGNLQWCKCERLAERAATLAAPFVQVRPILKNQAWPRRYGARRRLG